MPQQNNTEGGKYKLSLKEKRRFCELDGSISTKTQEKYLKFIEDLLKEKLSNI